MGFGGQWGGRIVVPATQSDGVISAYAFTDANALSNAAETAWTDNTKNLLLNNGSATTYTLTGSRTLNALTLGTNSTVAGTQTLALGADGGVGQAILNSGGTINNTVTLTAGSGANTNAELQIYVNGGSFHGKISDNGATRVSVVFNGVSGGATPAGAGAWTYSGDTIYNTSFRITVANFLPYGMGKGNVYVLANAALGGGGGQSLTINGLYGNGNCSPNILSLGYGDANGDFSGILSPTSAGTGSFAKYGSGTQSLRGLSSYAGGTTINGGVLVVGSLQNGGSASAIGASPKMAAALIFNAMPALVGSYSAATPTLRYIGVPQADTDRLFTLGTNMVSAGVYAGAIEADAGAGALNFNNTNAIAFSGSGPRTLVLGGSNSYANTFAPAIADGPGGATSLLKTGPSTWLLTGNNTFSGGMTVSGGILGGTGSLGGTVTNQAIITAADTNSIGMLTVANLVMAENSTYVWNYNGSTQDLINVTGTLTLPTVATVNVSQVSGTMPKPAVLFTFVTGAGAAASNGTLVGWVINGARPGTRVRVLNGQVIMDTPKGTLISIF